MSIKETAEEIDASAVVWAMRMEEGPLAEADEVRLQSWLAGGDERRLGALARARAVVVNSRRLAALSKDRPAAPALEVNTSRRRMLGTGLAASVLLGVGAGAALWRRSQVFETGRGEIDAMTLSDGSRVSLSAMSRISVRYTSSVRQIALTFGEALFEVAEDPVRPFVVQAVGAVLTASSGRFLLERTGQATLRVAAFEGQARVSQFERDTIIGANQRISLAGRPVEPVRPFNDTQAAQMLAWTDGKVALDNSTLSAAAEEFGRFRGAPILITDPDVAALTITGLFDANEPAVFAQAVALTLNLRAEISSDRIVLKRA